MCWRRGSDFGTLAADGEKFCSVGEDVRTGLWSGILFGRKKEFCDIGGRSLVFRFRFMHPFHQNIFIIMSSSKHIYHFHIINIIIKIPS